MVIVATDDNSLPMAPIFKQVREEIITFFNNSTTFIPGDGSKIRFWEHNWGFSILKHRLPYIYSYALQPELTLQQLATSQDMAINFRSNLSREAHLDLQTMMQWVSAMVLRPLMADEPKWNWTGTGEFTVQSAYRALKTGPCIDTDIKHICSLRAPPRMLLLGG